MLNRDSKMRRFCNYFVTLFNQKKLNPFTQFIDQELLTALKNKVKLRMENFGDDQKEKITKQSSAVFEEKPDMPVVVDLNNAAQ